MIDTEAAAALEQQAAAVDVPEGDPLYTPQQQEQLRRAALRCRQAAVTLEALAAATDARLAMSFLVGALRFVEEGKRLMGEVCGGEGGG